MKQYLTTDFAFAGTTIDPEPVRSYLFDMKLSYYEQAHARGEDEQFLKIYHYTELFEIRFKRYLAGFHKTLHLTMADVRAFRAYSPQPAWFIIPMIINQIRQHFLENEWYELMPRFEKAAGKIEAVVTSN